MFDAATLGAVFSSPLVSVNSGTASANASTAAGNWVDILNLEGYLELTVAVGSFVGTSLACVLMAGTDVNGTGAIAVPNGAFNTLTANGRQVILLPRTSIPARYLGIASTFVGTSFAFAASVQGSKKYA